VLRKPVGKFGSRKPNIGGRKAAVKGGRHIYRNKVVYGRAQIWRKDSVLRHLKDDN